jgi:hypothetical protein
MSARSQPGTRFTFFPPVKQSIRYNVGMTPLSDFDRGLFVGLLIGEGSFGGDGKQPQVTLRMHTRHEALFTWLMERFPSTRLYGPYHHGGRSYFQWMARGRALVTEVLPLLEREINPELDGYAYERLAQMRDRYRTFIDRERARVEE